MPIYEYLCNACEYKFEKLQKISDDPISVCPECNKDTVKKLISASKFRLAGSGWYETDFKTAKDTKRNLAESNSVSSNSSSTKENKSSDIAAKSNGSNTSTSSENKTSNGTN